MLWLGRGNEGRRNDQLNSNHAFLVPIPVTEISCLQNCVPALHFPIHAILHCIYSHTSSYKAALTHTHASSPLPGHVVDHTFHFPGQNTNRSAVAILGRHLPACLDSSRPSVVAFCSVGALSKKLV